MTDIERRVADMDQFGIDTDVLSVGNLDVSLAGGASLDLARSSNEAMASITKDFPSRFSALGVVPLNDPDAACDELDRMLGILDMVGVMIPTHVAGVPLDDSRFADFFGLAEARGAVLSIHPSLPHYASNMTDYGLVPLVGFIADTGIAVMRMVMSGMMERLGDLKLIVPHMGGMLHYLFTRIDTGWETNHDVQRNLPLPPSEYLKRMFFDLVNVNPQNLQCAVGLVGPDHLVFGTDYPFFTGRLNVDTAMAAMAEIGLDEHDQALISHINAERLFAVG
jgi:predicted TIM-barrel fold metal-dependent hydrolase